MKIKNKSMIAFGPVPSRRLGQSLGINHIPPKICSYSCIYCQLGRTKNMQVTRRIFYKVEEVIASVKKKVKKAKQNNEPIDYLTFVPDGEPTLDLNLGKEIDLLKSLGIKIAVITNSSLVWNSKIREELCKADWVSLKIDAVSEKIWRRINRPHKSLDLHSILKGMLDFADVFTGELVTETMLIQNINTDIQELEKIADFIARLKPNKSYISIPTRPPAEKWAVPADENSINVAYQVFKEKCDEVEYLIGYEGNAFAFTGNIEEDLLSITSVHPMREDAVKELLKRANATWSRIDNLINEKKIVRVSYQGKNYYIRKLTGSP